MGAVAGERTVQAGAMREPAQSFGWAGSATGEPAQAPGLDTTSLAAKGRTISEPA
jgi:hypothetical protein